MRSASTGKRPATVTMALLVALTASAVIAGGDRSNATTTTGWVPLTNAVQVGDVVYAGVGGVVGYNATTPAGTRCVRITGAHTAILANPNGAATWSTTFTAAGATGTRAITVDAFDTIAANGTCGGTALASVVRSYEVDASAPTITATTSAPAASTGWYRQAVTVTFTCSDAGSGVATCPPARTISTDGVTSVEGTVVDRLGQSSIVSVPVRMDRTPPSIGGTVVSTSGPNGGNGRNATGAILPGSSATIRWSCSDTTSGTPSCPADAVAIAGADGLAVRSTVTDAAGNIGSTLVTLAGTSGRRVKFGAAVPTVGGGKYGPVKTLESEIGRTLDVVRLYYRLDEGWSGDDDQIRTRDGGRMIAVSIESRFANGTGVPWSAVATAAPGSAIDNNMRVWARRVKAWGLPTYVIFNHEPEEPKTNHGRGAEFIAAWRHWVEVFRSEGVDNAVFTWTLSAWSFQTAYSGTEKPADYYPGDDVVDVIAADGYSWFECKAAGEKWRGWDEIFAGFRSFVNARPARIKAAMMEFGAVEDRALPGRKSAWIDEVSSLVVQPAWNRLDAILYFNRSDPDPALGACTWAVDSSPTAQSAFVRMAAAPVFRGPIPPPTTTTTTTTTSTSTSTTTTDPSGTTTTTDPSGTTTTTDPSGTTTTTDPSGTTTTTDPSGTTTTTDPSGTTTTTDPSGTSTSTSTTSTSTTSTSTTSTTSSSTTTTTTTPPTGPVTYIAAGTTWRYDDTGTDRGTAWRTLTYDDTAWKTGRAQLGYGDGDEATVISYGPDPANRNRTSYYRRTFTVTTPTAFTAIDLTALRDDGAVVYLNGTEIWRSNIPTGTVTYSTYGTPAAWGTDETTWQRFTAPTTLLRTGTNVVAVEIHQNMKADADASFDLTLTARR